MSTGNLARHLQSVHNIIEDKSEINKNNLKKFFDIKVHQNVLATTKPSKKWSLERNLVVSFSRDLLPFSAVEGV